jgi:hypothetical protein
VACLTNLHMTPQHVDHCIIHVLLIFSVCGGGGGMGVQGGNVCVCVAGILLLGFQEFFLGCA